MTDAPRPAPADLDAIQARADAATPGPWRVVDNGPCPYGGTHPEWHFYAVRSDDGELDISGNTSAEDPFYAEQGEADAAFIAAARADVPALVAEVRALQQELAFTKRAAAWNAIPGNERLPYIEFCGKPLIPPEVRDPLMAATPITSETMAGQLRFADGSVAIPLSQREPAQPATTNDDSTAAWDSNAPLVTGPAQDGHTTHAQFMWEAYGAGVPDPAWYAPKSDTHQHPFPPPEEGTATC